MLPREGWPAWMIKSTIALGQGGDRFRHRLRRRWCFSITSSPPGISSAGPIRSAARRAIEQVVDRAQAELQKTGATWIATTDYRTYSMLRWYFNGRVPVIQINERGRFHRLSRSRHGFDQGSYRALCRARARQRQPAMGVHHGGPGAAGAGRPQLARHRDGHLCAGKTDRLDAGAFAAAGFAALSRVARWRAMSGCRCSVAAPGEPTKASQTVSGRDQ